MHGDLYTWQEIVKLEREIGARRQARLAAAGLLRDSGPSPLRRLLARLLRPTGSQRRATSVGLPRRPSRYPLDGEEELLT